MKMLGCFCFRCVAGAPINIAHAFILFGALEIRRGEAKQQHQLQLAQRLLWREIA